MGRRRADERKPRSLGSTFPLFHSPPSVLRSGLRSSACGRTGTSTALRKVCTSTGHAAFDVFVGVEHQQLSHLTLEDGSHLFSCQNRLCKGQRHPPVHTSPDTQTKILSDGAIPHLAKQFVAASRLVPFLSVTICRADASESDKSCPGASRSLALSVKQRGMFASVAPLSDMAVPKALPIPASQLEERRRRLYKDP